MDGWQVGLEYVKALVWPGVAIFFGWRFKMQAGRLLDRLVSLKTPAGTAEFDRQARDVVIEAQAAEAKQVASAMDEEQTEQTVSEETSDTTTGDDTVEKASSRNVRRGQSDESVLPAEMLKAWTANEFDVYRDVAAIDPAAAVMGAWRRVEQFMHLALRAREINERWPNATVILRQLQELGLGPHFVRVADELRRLRNSVVHSRDANISIAGALDYIDAAERLSDALMMFQARRLD